MPRNSYLNVPEEIANKIEKKVDSPQSETFRFLYHTGKPNQKDFIPTFKDERQKELRERRKQLGKMANVVVEQHSPIKNNISEYAVSLFSDLEKGKKILWKNDSSKKDYPAIAKGPTDSDKGYTVLDKNQHISYFLFDYDNNSPYSDFSTIEEAENNE